MNNSADSSHNPCLKGIDETQQRRHRGLIVFCEKNLRYENGLKAWIFLGPYLFGAFALEIIFMDGSARTDSLTPWAGLIAYLILFPIIWRKFLRFIASAKTRSVTEPHPGATGSR
jgi:hypothetical protein